MAAGVIMNLIVALVLFMIVAWVGMPKLVDNQFTIKSDTKIIKNEVLATDIQAGSAAAQAGMQPDDQLVALGPVNAPVNVTDANTLPKLTKQYAGQKVKVVFNHKGTEHSAIVTLLSAAAVTASQHTDNPKGYLGVVPVSYTLQRSTWSAPIVAVGVAGQFTGMTFLGLGHALGGLGSTIAGAITGNHAARENGQTSASSQVSGPVGIFVILQDGSLLGYQFVLLLIAIISLTLAIMNILPIPALDGGRLWLTLFTRGIKKPLRPEREELINGIGFAILLTLIVVITVVDVKRFL
jgi:regulator of sigma E protease